MRSRKSTLIINPEQGTIDRLFVSGKVHHRVGSDNGNGRLQIAIDEKFHLVHRVIWVHVNGEIPDHLQVDHINGNPLDNRIANLRLVTREENGENRHRANANSKTGVKGVFWHGRDQKFVAQIRSKGKKTSLGYFDRVEDAAAAYARAAAAVHTHNPMAAA